MSNFDKTYYNEELGDIDRDISEYWSTLNTEEFDGVDVIIAPFSDTKIAESSINRASEEDVLEYLAGDKNIPVDIIGFDEVFQGLIVISRYFENDHILVTSTKTDTLFSVSIDEIVEAGLTIDDLIILTRLNWMPVSGHLAVYT